MNYAMIKNGVIDNIIVADYTMAQTIKQLQEYDEAINCDNYPVGIGDLCENGAFMIGEDVRDEQGNILIPARTVIERNITAEEQVKVLEADNLALGQMITDLELRLLTLEVI